MGLNFSKIAQPNYRGSSYKDLIEHFITTCLSTKRGKLLIFLWSSGILGSILIAIKQHKDRKARKRLRSKEASATDLQQQSPGKKQLPGLMTQLKTVFPLAFPSIWNEATMYLGFYTVCLMIRILLTIKIATLTGKLGKMIGSGEFTKMFHNQVIFGLWCFPAAVINSLLPFFSNKLSLSVRQNLTKYIHNRYMAQLIFYRANNIGSGRIDDIDQRITQDMKKFCTSLIELYGNILKPLLELIFYSHTLGKLMGGKQLAGFFAFFLIAGQWLSFVMPPFAELTTESQKLEGEFRSHHTRLINHSEEIAFYGGSDREKDIVNDSFKSIVRHSNKHFLLQCLMGMLDTYLVKYGASMTAYSTMIPAVYLGLQGLKGKSTSQIMQYYLTSTQLFVALGTACRNLVLSYKRIQSLTGLSVRVWELLQELKARASNSDENQMKSLALANPNRTGGEPQVIIGDEITFKDVDIFSPTGQLLLKGLNFTVSKNTNVLISGRNGSGKSSLFRVLGGLWPLCSGTLIKPEQSKLFYIPQKPYMAPGTLRDQVTYPLTFKGGDPELETKLHNLMELVELSYLVQRESWDAVRDWNDVLSGGEKQRIAMARLFFHRPAFGILDECTSAVSQDVEAKIYQTCQKLGITIFTVSHRPQLMHHHDYMLKLDGEGGWSWEQVHK